LNQTLLVSYDSRKKSTGKPIVIQNSENSEKSFTGLISGSGDLIMAYNPALKESIGKICVLQVDNFKSHSIDSKLIESDRVWFCKGNFTQYDKNGKLNPNYANNKPLVLTDAKGKNRKNVKSIEFKNVQFEIKFNNAISKEKQSGSTSILRVFN
jgi:hypothetical protein